MFPEEQWKPIPGLEQWEASDQGGIRNSLTKKVLKQHRNIARHGKEYLKITLGRRGKINGKRVKGKRYFVHRLVLLAFAGKPPFEKAQGCHINDDGLDNTLKNLEWGTHSKNQEDRCNPFCECSCRYDGHDQNGMCQTKIAIAQDGKERTQSDRGNSDRPNGTNKK